MARRSVPLREHKHMGEAIERLAKIEGHVRGIKRMAEEGRSCDELLIQLAAVRSALNQVTRLILEDHLESCVLSGIAGGEPVEAVNKLKEALAKIF
ncbi:MAG: metal-sensitive transcriptional regulator [Bacillota bacterium]|nr:metal-sensitive transcriptional regulator [Bacillota bacterium]